MGRTAARKAYLMGEAIIEPRTKSNGSAASSHCAPGAMTIWLIGATLAPAGYA
jgi:hypothetical protein